MDDESFRARVHKVFGCLPSSSPSPSASVWSLSDDDVEKNEWNRSSLKQGKDDDDHNLCSSSYDGLFKQKRRNMLENLIDDDGSSFDDVWEIRSSIGLDSTLDNEVFTQVTVLFCFFESLFISFYTEPLLQPKFVISSPFFMH